MRRFRPVLLLLPLLVSCDDSPSGPRPHPDRVTATIGPAGGVLRSKDGRVSLTVPAGALAAEENLFVEPLDSAALGSEFAGVPVGAAYELGPDGMAFMQPVTVALRSDQSPRRPDGSIHVEGALLFTSRGGVLEALDSLRIEVVADSVVARGELTHFSPLVETEFGGLVSATVTGFPDRAELEQPFPLTLEYSGEILVFRSVAYGAPFGTVKPLPAGATHTLEALGPNQFRSVIQHRCTAAGDGKYTGGFIGSVQAGPPSSVLILISEEMDCLEPVRELVVTRTGTGAGTVTSAPSGISCGAGCGADSASYPLGITVTLTAAAAEGSSFVGWSGDCSGTAAAARVVMNAAKTCHARFDVVPTGPRLLYLSDLPGGAFMEAAALAPADAPAPHRNTLVTVDGSANGTLRLFDLSDPSNPIRGDSITRFCPGARSLHFAKHPFIQDPYFLAFSTGGRQSCDNTLPPGLTQLRNLSYAPGEGAAIPDTTTYAVASFDQGGLSIVGASGPPAFIPLSETRSCPFSVAVSADGERAFVVGREGVAGTSTEACNDNRALFVVDLEEQEVVGSVPLGGEGSMPRDIVLSPDGGTAFVTNFGEDLVHVVDVSGDVPRVVRSFAAGDGPTGVGLLSGGLSVVVASWNGDEVHVFDAASGAPQAHAPSRGRQPVTVLTRDNLVIVVSHGAEGGPGGITLMQWDPTGG